MTRYYHFWKLFSDVELNKETSIKEFLIDVGDGKKIRQQLLQYTAGGKMPHTLIAPEGHHIAAIGGVIRPKGDISVTACKRTQ